MDIHKVFLFIEDFEIEMPDVATITRLEMFSLENCVKIRMIVVNPR